MNPCFGCQRRYIACHAECNEYHGWLIKREAEKAAVKKQHDVERDANNFKFERYLRDRNYKAAQKRKEVKK